MSAFCFTASILTRLVDQLFDLMKNSSMTSYPTIKICKLCIGDFDNKIYLRKDEFPLNRSSLCHFIVHETLFLFDKTAQTSEQS